MNLLWKFEPRYLFSYSYLGGHYDLAITDNTMPKMTGLEIIEKLRSARMAIPVIMATRSLPLDEIARKPWLKPDAMLQWPFPMTICWRR